MKTEDLKAGVIYHWSYASNGTDHIGKVYRNGRGQLGPHIDLKGKGHVFPNKDNNYSINSGINTCRLATPDEIRMFHASIKAGRIVDGIHIDTLEIF